MKKRLIYEAPKGELILVRFEENILSGTPTSLGDRLTGGAGASGYNGDAFDSDDNHHDL